VALRRIAVMAIALFMINFFMHLGLLLPRQAIREVEERKGTGRTGTVERVWVPEIHKTHLVYLSQNENVTMLSTAYLTHLGWMPGFGNALDCSGGEPLYAGFTLMNRKERSAMLFFGRVDDPQIAQIEIVVYAEEYDERSYAVNGREVRRFSDVEMLEQSGRRYFLVKDGGEWDFARDFSPRPHVAAYNAAGEELLFMEITDWNSSHWG
jgi:hypothetical protein